MKGSDFHRVTAAISYLEGRGAAQPTLDEVAARVGMSPFHFQRLFQRWAGISPKRFLQYQSLQQARRMLAASRSLLDASDAAGLSSASRLHDLFLTWEAMTPGEFKDPSLEVAWGVHPTPLGATLVATTHRGLCGIDFLEADDRAAALAVLRERWPFAALVERPARTRAFAQALRERFEGRLTEPLALVLRGTPFQLQTWEALLRIPAGEVTTYGQLARGLGRPGASRAVGAAVGQNPIGFLIPCHRVIQASGVLGGYRWGGVRKRALLGVEWARADAQRVAVTGNV